MRPSRVVLTIAGLSVAVIALRSCRLDDRTNTSVAPTDGRHVLVEPIGPTRTVRGVPQGWRHDPTGARAAAIADVALTGDIAHAGPLARRDMVIQLASNRYGPTLVDTTDHQISELLDALGQADIDPTRLVWLESPLTARIQPVATSTTVRVEVWSLLVAGAPDTGAPRQAWRTVTITLVWEDHDWKIDSWSVRPGPTPALAPETAISALAHLSGPARWPAALRKDP